MIAERTRYTLPYVSDRYPEGFLSPSSVVDFLRCGECFRLARIERMPRPMSIHLPIGHAVHRAQQFIRNLTLEGDARVLPSQIEEATQMAADAFSLEITQPIDEETGKVETPLEIDLGKYDSLGKAKDHALALVKFAIPKLLELDRSRGKIASTEWNLEMLPSPYPFTIRGQIDTLYVDWLEEPDPAKARIMADTKTSAKLSPPDEYTALAQTMYEEHFARIIVIADVISKRETKGKGFQPELQSFPLTVDERSRDLVHQTVLGVAEDISAGRFRPHPNFLCSYIHGWPEFQVAVSGFPEAE